MKRTQVVDSERLKLKRKTIVQLEDKQLESITGGCQGSRQTEQCGSRLCSGH